MRIIDPAQMHLSIVSPIGFAQTWNIIKSCEPTCSIRKCDNEQDAVIVSSFNKQIASPFSFGIGW